MTEINLTSLHAPLTVSELNRLSKQLLEQHFPLLSIAGEVSNFTRAASGHWYFSLKDERAQIRCVMFKGRNTYANFTPRDGEHVEARATLSLYEARGDIQLTGLGRLHAAFEQLKAQLQSEGLFDAARKKAIPAQPRCIGIVTSADAAALQDVLTTLRRRQPGLRVIIYPSPVQGKEAPAMLANAIATASTRAEVDTLLICRGGGSLEDLWAFNESIVARAIAACTIPTISGVGHETDITISDFVADLRAATPTAAAELCCPDQLQLKAQLERWQQRLMQCMQAKLQQQSQTLDFLSRRLLSPVQQIQQRQQWCQQWQHRLRLACRQQLQRQQQHLQQLASSLQQLNPQQVLARGFALVHSTDGVLVSSQQAIHAGQMLRLTFADGNAAVQVSADHRPVNANQTSANKRS